MKRLRKIYLDRPFLNRCTICNKKIKFDQENRSLFQPAKVKF